MENGDTKRFSRNDIAIMKEKDEVRPTPADAPEITLDESFWQKARIVETRPRRKTSAHLPKPTAQARAVVLVGWHR